MNIAEELERLAWLHESGALGAEEYAAAKALTLGIGSGGADEVRALSATDVARDPDDDDEDEPDIYSVSELTLMSFAELRVIADGLDVPYAFATRNSLIIKILEAQEEVSKAYADRDDDDDDDGEFFRSEGAENDEHFG